LIITDKRTIIKDYKEKLLKFINLVFLFVMLYLTACNSSSTSALIGKWVSEEEPNVVFEFLEDGAGIFSLGKGDIKFTWTVVEKGQLIMTFTERPVEPIDFVISGSVLILGGDKFNKWKQ
jgi:hypothetical protein